MGTEFEQSTGMAATEDGTPLLSLVVATFGRRQELTSLLRSIAAQNVRDVEVIVVDQNEQPLTHELLAPHGVTVLHLRSCVRNASAARNLGAAAAKAGWLMFPDDDASFLSDTLDHLLALIRQDGYDLIGGQIVDASGRPHLLQWPRQACAITPDTLDDTLVESSFAIRREVFFSAGGFDPLFGPGGIFHSGEGADLVRRLWRAGPVPARFTPGISLQHPAKLALSGNGTCDRIYRFAVGEGALTARHHAQLSMITIARKLLFRVAGACVSTGEKRRRKLAFLSGFLAGVTQYWRMQRTTVASARTLNPETNRVSES